MYITPEKSVMPETYGMKRGLPRTELSDTYNSVNDVVTRLHEQASILADSIGILDARLQPLYKCVPEKPFDDSVQDCGSDSALAQEIIHAIHRITRLTAQVDAMIGRIQL